MIARPPEIGRFLYIVLAQRRTVQLRRGCTPNVEGKHTVAVTAQREVAEGHIVQSFAVASPDQRNGNGEPAIGILPAA